MRRRRGKNGNMANTASDASQLWRVRAFYAAFATALIAGIWLSGRQITMSGSWRGSSAPSSPPTAQPKSQLDDETEVLAMPTPSTLDELHDALARDCCVLYIDVDWSVDSVLGRRVFNRFVQAWNARPRRPGVAFFRIDATRSEGPVYEALVPSCSQWLTLGYGTILYLQHGEIIDAVARAADETPGTLSARTERVFARQ